MSMHLTLYISCPKGLEYLLRDELTQLGCEIVKVNPAGVEITCDHQVVARICLWSRVANRVLLPLATTRKADRDGLYQMAAKVDWKQFIEAGQAYWISSFGQQGMIKHSGFGAQIINDAIKDYFREQELTPPVIDQKEAKQVLQLSIGRKISLSLDVAGRSLHQRGYRLDGEQAPLKENLAAALLYRARWALQPDKLQPGEESAENASYAESMLLDPMCGSGTLIIEGAMMAMDIAPGLLNPDFLFLRSPWFEPSAWTQELASAQERAVLGKRSWQGSLVGVDINPAVVRSAKRNAARAGLDRWIEFRKGDATENGLFADQAPEGRLQGNSDSGMRLLICNPPYGKRLGQELELRAFYQNFGRQIKVSCQGWQVAVLTANKFLAKELGMRAEREYQFFNGKLPTTLYLFSVYQHAAGLKQDGSKHPEGDKPGSQNLPASKQRVFSQSAQMFANRLLKNQKRLKRWLGQQNIEAYRLYDADIPEYAVAVDRYGDCVCVQEYAPPRQIDGEKAKQRLLDVFEVVPAILGIESENLYFKQRQQQKGDQQYQRHQHQQKTLVVNEHGCLMQVNLSDYLDTGLFLDHRPIRQFIQEQSAGKHFLNLFCYTASASVHAAKGGALTTTSVDLSNTYLNWAQQNFKLNSLWVETPQKKANSGLHQLVKSDVMAWLQRESKKFDMIFLDPPTFSNSKNMANALDLQRDQSVLIKATMKRLARNGLLIFSTNNRRFKLEKQLTFEFNVVDKTKFSLPPDFARKRIHQCWFIKHKVN